MRDTWSYTADIHCEKRHSSVKCVSPIRPADWTPSSYKSTAVCPLDHNTFVSGYESVPHTIAQKTSDKKLTVLYYTSYLARSWTAGRLSLCTSYRAYTTAFVSG